MLCFGLACGSQRARRGGDTPACRRGQLKLIALALSWRWYWCPGSPGLLLVLERILASLMEEGWRLVAQSLRGLCGPAYCLALLLIDPVSVFVQFPLDPAGPCR